jgi:hypothetical protein
VDDAEKIKEIAKLDYAAYRAESSERLKYQIDLAQNCIRSLTLINGGAIVAIFTLIGNMSDRSSFLIDPARIWWAFGSFSAGLAFSIAAWFGAFFSQYHFGLCAEVQSWHEAEKMHGSSHNSDFMTHYRSGSRSFAVGVTLAVLSLIAFISGSWFALSGVLDAG